MAHFIFMGAFFTVLTVVAGTLLFAFWRSLRSMPKAEEIRWHSEFHDLPASSRACRHVLTGEFRKRECPNSFDCRLCEVHARMPQRRAAETEEEICGMPFPPDRYYHRGHTWARVESDGAVVIGLDEFGKRMIGEPDLVVLPAAGERIHANGTAFRVRKRNADVRILAPVDGEVLEASPAGREWFLRVRPDNTNFTHLLRGPEVRPWMLREMERLQLALSVEGAPTLADGGAPVPDISAACPQADWDNVCGEIFLAS